MAEQEPADPELEKIIHLICNGDMDELYEITDDSNPIEAITPGKIITNRCF